jgi:hypothetical protein
MFERDDRTKPFLIRYALYLYFLLGLSLRSTSKALEPFVEERSYMLQYGIGYRSLIQSIYTRIKRRVE